MMEQRTSSCSSSLSFRELLDSHVQDKLPNEVAPNDELTGQLPFDPASKHVENSDQQLTENQSSSVAAAAEKVAAHHVMIHEDYEEVSRKLPNSSAGSACQEIVPLAHNLLSSQDYEEVSRKLPNSSARSA